MRSLLLSASLTFAVACSGGAPQEVADEPATEQSSPAAEAPNTDTTEPAAAEAEPAAVAKIDLDAVEDLDTLFTVTDNVDRDQVAGIIGQRKPDIYDCYGAQLSANPGMTGRVLVQITATAGGEVASAIVKQSTLKVPAVETCMTKRMRSWKFPNDSSGGLIVVKYAFQLPP